MATYHTVEQGEHISRIAARYGLDDYRAVWAHPKNVELAGLRRNPHVLFPGDLVFIPDKQRKKEAVATGLRHRFRLSATPIKLRVVLKDVNHRPLASTPCELHVEDKVHRLVTDENGMIEQQIPKTAEHCRVTILDREVSVKVGHIDPIESISGQQARLNNLGYQAGAVNGREDVRFRSAVEEFQCNHDLPVDGVCGPATQSKLKQVHGC